MNTVPRINPATLRSATRIPEMDPLEWEARIDLAACYRLVDLFGMCDLHLNHISARVPGKEEHFLINPFGMMYEEITASSLIKIDLAGNIVANCNPEYSINLPGYVIHSAIHAARSDVACVVHTHTNAGMAVSTLACGLLPLTQTAMRWSRIAYHDFEGVVVDLDEQKRLVENLGGSEVMILRNHGLLSVGPDHRSGLQQHLSPGASLPDPASGHGLPCRAVDAGRGRGRPLERPARCFANPGRPRQETSARIDRVAGAQADAGPARSLL